MPLRKNSRKTKKRKILRESSRLEHAALTRARLLRVALSVQGRERTCAYARALLALYYVSGSLRLGLCLCCHKASPTRFIRGL